MGGLRATCALAALLAACAPESDPAQLFEVVPSEISSLVATSVAVNGSNLFAQIVVKLDDGDKPARSQDFGVTIGPAAFAPEAVSYRGPDGLDVSINAGQLPVGPHDVVVQGPDGTVLSLPQGLRVLDDAELVLSIENAGDGGGNAFGATTIRVDDVVELFAVGRRGEGGEFLFAVDGEWSLDGVGSLDLRENGSAAFSSDSIGTATISFDHPIYGMVTVTVEVVECLVTLDCADACRSGNSCESNSCVQAAVDKDSDGDGGIDAACGGDDCNDEDLSVYVGATEVVDNGIDNDCDGAELCYADGDDDGYRPNATATVVSTNMGCLDAGEAEAADPTGDCNDGVSTIYPGAPEVTNDGTDQSCDGLEVCYDDTDGDNFVEGGSNTVSSSDLSCTGALVHNETTAPDCVDTDSSIFPTAIEGIADGVDQNCDGDELCYDDSDDDDFVEDGDKTVLSVGNINCTESGEHFEPTVADCVDTDNTIFPTATEGVADGVDQNCDGDELCYDDTDNDNFVQGGSDTVLNSDLSCMGLLVHNTTTTPDCNDDNGAINPDASETCDGVDNDCSAGTADGSDDATFGDDCDGTDTDLCEEGTVQCNGTALFCSDTTGNNTETVANGTDDDCDGFELCYDDTDNDNFVEGGSNTITSADLTCTGEGVHNVTTTDDCDDTDGDAYPGATETPGDGTDQDCDGFDDCYTERDGDGYGGNPIVTDDNLDCDDASTLFTTSTGGDCDDDVFACGAACSPVGTETCDGYDNDCNPATVDADDPLVGTACDGADSDKCTDGTWSCASGTLSCSDPDVDTLEVCTGGVDEDCDTDIDAADSDCTPLECAAPGPAAPTPPVARFTVNHGGGKVVTRFVFDGQDSYDLEDSDGNLSFAWDWDSNGTIDAVGIQAVHSFASEGTKLVTLRVRDTAGLDAYYTGYIMVSTAAKLIVVDTASNAVDATDGLTSLREAIPIANTDGLQSTIVFTEDFNIVTLPPLPAISGSEPTHIVGPSRITQGSTVVDCLSISSTSSSVSWIRLGGCDAAISIETAASNVRVSNTEVDACAIAVDVSGDNSTIGPNNYFHDQSAQNVALRSSAAGSEVYQSRLYDSGGGSSGIVVFGSNSFIWANEIVRSGNHGINLGDGGAVVGATIWHNTLHDNGNDGVRVGDNSSSIDIRNNATEDNSHGVHLDDDATFIAFDSNNMPDGCSGCGAATNTTTLDPLYISQDAPNDDYRLCPASPIIDTGNSSVTVDMNFTVDSPLLYNGSVFDRGAFETSYP